LAEAKDMQQMGLQINANKIISKWTSCAGSCHNMPPPPASWPFDLENGVWVMCDVDYLCANFSLPRPPRSGLRPDVRDRQTSDRQMSDAHHHL